MFVDYPYFHTCTATGQGATYLPIIGKEEVQVAHIKKNLYKIKRINGTIINDDSVTYIITKDSTHYKDGITYALSFNKIKDGKEHYAVIFRNPGNFGGPTNEGYQTCIRQAPDTTGISPSTQGRAVKPE